MFTGIIETVGTVKEIKQEGSNKSFLIESTISSRLKINQSVSHNGVCLTIVEVNGNCHRVTAVEESLQKTDLNNWSVGNKINLERSMKLNSLVDGHLVQGHVDQTAICKLIEEKNGSHHFYFAFKKKANHIMIDKGSVTVNGISLTVVRCTKKKFTVAIIPYTFEHTNFSSLKKNDAVNIEFDVIGKYVEALLKK